MAGTYLQDLPRGRALNMVLIGKTGQGKSETGNTILGEKHFKSDDDVHSCTLTNAFVKLNVGGRLLNVVDTPGVMDTKKGHDILKEIADSVTLHPEGYDAFLIVLRYPNRMTREEVECIMQLEKMFGKELYNYAIVIFTFGDLFNKKQAKAATPITFEEYVEKASVSDNEYTLGPLMKKVNNRYLLFDNEGDCIQKRKSVIELVEMIDNNSRRRRYSNHIFQRATKLKELLPTQEKRSQSLFEYIQQSFPQCTLL